MAWGFRRIAMGRGWVVAAVVTATALGAPSVAAPAKATPGKKPVRRAGVKPKVAVPARPAALVDASTTFFKQLRVPRLKIQVSEEHMNTLRGEARVYVPCTIVEDDKTTYENVGVKIKGAAGSSRPIDDKPALTLNFDKYNKELKFHDLDKIHLNNSVQDPTYLKPQRGDSIQPKASPWEIGYRPP